MATIQVVKSGECISTIAENKGFLWQKIWNDPGNANLKQARKHPNILKPGDRVLIPEKELREETGDSEQRHRFRREGVGVRLHLRLLSEGEPISDTSFTLIEGVNEIQGETDQDGNLEEKIPIDWMKASLLLEGEQEIELEIGALEPITEIKGVQARLRNLGLYGGKIDGIVGVQTEGALREFQRREQLEESGRITQETRCKLEERHGC